MNRLRLAGVVLALCLFPGGARAELILDPTHPALAGASLEPFVPAYGPNGATSISFTRDGVTFTFTTTNPAGFYFCGPTGECGLRSPYPGGIVVAITPPVAAIAFVHRWFECPGLTTFIGSAGTEVYEPPFPPGSYFVGAANIGDITGARLESQCFPQETWDNMLFVPGSGPPPPTETDVRLLKTGPALMAGDADVQYGLQILNEGAATAAGVRVTDFIPPELTFQSSFPPPQGTFERSVTLGFGDVPAGGDASGLMALHTLPFEGPLTEPHLSCETSMVNVAIATSASPDTNLLNNRTLHVARFDKSTRFGIPEICTNGIDDNCDGRTDCGDSACNCVPAYLGGPSVVGCEGGFEPVVPALANGTLICARPAGRNAVQHHCEVPRGACGGVRVPSWCCELQTWSTVTPEALARLDQCNVGVPGCVPRDPNFKDTDPPVNINGYGYAFAGQRMRYVLHYENVGDADAHDVLVIDALDEDLDAGTLTVEDGGVYDAATRAITWTDPVVPPHAPRAVRFSVNLRADAPELTRVRNVGTVVFPDAVPPTRIDTNFVEHMVIAPGHAPVADLKVIGCDPEGGNRWRVRLLNEGHSFAYNVTAAIVDPPASVTVLEGSSPLLAPRRPRARGLRQHHRPRHDTQRGHGRVHLPDSRRRLPCPPVAHHLPELHRPGLRAHRPGGARRRPRRGAGRKRQLPGGLQPRPGRRRR